ncbi:MAG: metallophosphoesterase [Methylococcales bacterium]|nr:metallophosphoesterase [Methylococcales bacterium]
MIDDKRILFAGDPHGDFESIITAVEKHQPKAVILLGDYDLKKPLEDYIQAIMVATEVWWIPGNHDFESVAHYDNLFSSQLAEQGLHLKVKEIAGLRIAGLGGIFLGRVWYPPRKPKWRSKQHFLGSQSGNDKSVELSLKYQSAIWYDEWIKLKKLKADILVTHEAPRSHPHGFIAIDQLAEAMGVKQIFHGHLHEYYSTTIRKGIKVVGVRDAGVADLSGNEL